MRKFLNLLVISLVVVGCDSAENASSTPYGCYDLSTHMCDCESTMMACETAGLIWTDTCACDGSMPAGRPMMSDAGSMGGGSMGGGSMGGADTAGCYDPMSHMCDCDTDEAMCMTGGGVWSDRCGCGEEPPARPDAGMPAEDAGSMSSGSGGPEGCYDIMVHRCNCDTDQETCEMEGGIWTDQCMCM